MYRDIFSSNRWTITKILKGDDKILEKVAISKIIQVVEKSIKNKIR